MLRWGGPRGGFDELEGAIDTEQALELAIYDRSDNRVTAAVHADEEEDDDLERRGMLPWGRDVRAAADTVGGFIAGLQDESDDDDEANDRRLSPEELAGIAQTNSDQQEKSTQRTYKSAFKKFQVW
jgi:hypothetical protein